MDLLTATLFLFVGRGIGPDTFAPVLIAVSIILLADLSKTTASIVATESLVISELNKLMNDVKTRNYIYLDAGDTSILKDPTFLSEIKSGKPPVIIIEDGENLLKDRKEKHNDTSTLLNLSEGLLTNDLGILFIITFNAEYNVIDSALKRKGRLKFNYQFEKLNKEKAINLAKHLQIDDFVYREDMTLSDVYNFNEEQYHKENTIGFF